MKTTYIVLLFLFMIINYPKAQESSSKAIEGSCSEVITNLQKEIKNDSLVVKTFYDNYIVLGNSIDLKKKNHKEVIAFFSKTENKHINCCLKDVYYQRCLLKTTDE